jgi:hypothetical protein
VYSPASLSVGTANNASYLGGHAASTYYSTSNPPPILTANAGAVGSLVFAWGSGNINYGDLLTGVSLSPGWENGSQGGVGGTTPVGTWMCLGYISNGGRTLFQRIA